MRTPCWLGLAATLLVPSAALADAVLDWNAVAIDRVEAAKQTSPDAARAMAMTHAAIFDAVNAIEPTYAPYAFKGSAPEGASPDAAVAAAASTVLGKLYPEQAEAIQAAYAASIARIPAGAGRDAGVALGEQAGAACLAARASDGTGIASTYRPRTAPGAYVPTAMPICSEWPKVKPFVLERGAQFRPAPPPALSSATWARDYGEIKAIGGMKSTARTKEQTDVARFWTITGPLSWNPLVRALAMAKPASLLENARLFAIVNMAGTDAYIAVFDAKYEYNFWRPVTAIRSGGDDPAWLPLVETPMHPEYPCAHCICAGAVGEVLEARFGKDELPPIAMTSPAAPGVTRRWTRIADYVQEVDNARVWGGVHFRTSTEVGEAMGRRIGKLAAATLLPPVAVAGRGAPSR